MDELQRHAEKNVRDIVVDAIELSAQAQAVVIYDVDSPLALALTDAYRAAVPKAEFILFDPEGAKQILERIDKLSPGDLVVLVQSTNFRLNAFRFRIELFKRSLKTVEHIHLNRFTDDQFDRYIDALAYDKNYYRPLGHALKSRVDACTKIVVKCPGTELVYDCAFESTRLNIGDYSAMNNTGGTFPIGEVFSEPVDLSAVNGQVKIFAYPDTGHIVRECEPFMAIIQEGILSAPDAPPAFKEILAMIEEKSPVHVREFGLGLNRAMGKGAIINDVTAFERMAGVHLSLGSKHSIYKKPGLPRKASGYHIDVFLDLEEIMIDQKIVYTDGSYTL